MPSRFVCIWLTDYNMSATVGSIHELTVCKDVKKSRCAKSTYMVSLACVNSIYGEIRQETRGCVEKRVKKVVDKRGMMW